MTDNPFEVQTSGDVGEPIPLISQGNHAPAEWAAATSKLILDTHDLSGDRLISALQLQAHVAVALADKYEQVISREIDHLRTFPDHSDSDYDVADIARHVVTEIRGIAKGTDWQDLIDGAEWAASAWLTIANHLSTAIHVERLLFSDRNPDNTAAVAYKRRFQG